MEFSDDRLAGVLHRLSDDEAWEGIEKELWAAAVTVYELEVSGVRLDSTTSYGYHQVSEEGVMQFGHSKDHRPDLPQLKLMAAAAEPSGHLVACDLEPGQRADDPLYTPLIQRVRRLLGRRGLLYAGDCKMAALTTRAEMAAHQDYYVMPLPLTGETAAQFEAWVKAAVLHYRGGWSLERDSHQLKDRPLGLSPLFVWKDDQIKGRTRLLTLALRLLTLIETQVRQAPEHTQQTLAGLYEGQPSRTTERPTGKRILKAFTRAHITLTQMKLGASTYGHLTPLSALHEQLLRHLHLPTSLYTALAHNSS